MVTYVDAAAVTVTGMLRSFDTMFGRAPGAMIRRYPRRATPLMNMSRSLRPLLGEGIRRMVRHPYDGPQGTYPRHEVSRLRPEAQGPPSRRRRSREAGRRMLDGLRQSHHRARRTS